MRRIVFFLASFAALAVPAAALPAHLAAGDGTLVVKNGSAPDGVPVVKLTITGSVIGQVAGGGKIIIDSGPKGAVPEVTAGTAHDVIVPKGTSAQWWASNDGFKFRAVNGKFTIVIYGTGVGLVAIGTGTVVLQGMPDTPHGDGRYSLEGADLVSLPGSPTKQLTIGDDS
jgi:hypothetical protein